MSLLVLGGYVGCLLIFAWQNNIEGLKTAGSILGPLAGAIAG